MIRSEIPTPRTTAKPATPNWREAVRPFQRPSLWRSSWQLTNSIGGYALLWIGMYFTSQISLWLTALLAVVAGGFLVRIFIIFHDCTHNSFFRSMKANEAWGTITGILSFTPYHHWKWEHATHHAHSGDLDHRGLGDVWTMTVQEYEESSRRDQESGSFIFSINSKACPGNEMRNGILRRPPCRGVSFTDCRKSSSGFPGTLGSTTSTI